MNHQNKIWKSAPLVLGAVLLALVTLFGFIEGIPFATKDQVKEKFEALEKNHDKEIADLKEKDKLLESLKNQDNEWYRELAQEVAVLNSRMGRVEKQLDRIEGLLMERR